MSEASEAMAANLMARYLTDEALAERLEMIARHVRRFDPNTRRALLLEASRRILGEVQGST